MKVLLHAAVDVSRPGGLETHVRELAAGLAARGHEVEIFGAPARLEPFRMTDRLEPARYDVVHHHGGVWPRGLDPGPACVRTFHFSVAEKMRVYLGLGRIRTLANLPNWIVLADERRTARRAAAVLCVSRKLAGEIARHHGVPAERIAVVPNGASFDPPSEPREALRARHGIAPGRPVLLTTGREDFVKGLGLLERAWRAARRGDATWVHVGGHGPSRGPGRIETGEIPRREALDWIHAADVAAVPSHYEGGGIALLDYAAAGLYTLAHDVGNAAEVIVPGVNGEIVARDPGAWVSALDRALAEPRARTPGMLADDYRWPRIVERVEGVYRSVAAGGPAALAARA